MRASLLFFFASCTFASCAPGVRAPNDVAAGCAGEGVLDATGVSSCIARPSLVEDVLALQVVGPGRVRVAFEWLPESLNGGHADESGGYPWFVDFTPRGHEIVAHGGCRRPSALAHDRDGTVHVLCVDVAEAAAGQPVRALARHGFARAGAASPIVFDAEREIFDAVVTGGISTRARFFSGFDGGGPYADVRVEETQRGATLASRTVAGGFFALRASGSSVLALPAELEPARRTSDGIIAAYAEERRVRVIFAAQERERTLLFSTETASVVADWSPVWGRSPLVASEDEGGVVFHLPGQPRRSSTEPRRMVVASGHALTPIESWPSDTAIVASGRSLELRRAGSSGAAWAARLEERADVGAARASCDATSCVVVASVVTDSTPERPHERGSFLRVFRFARPW